MKKASDVIRKRATAMVGKYGERAEEYARAEAQQAAAVGNSDDAETWRLVANELFTVRAGNSYPASCLPKTPPA